jgi:hypothetical protein
MMILKRIYSLIYYYFFIGDKNNVIQILDGYSLFAEIGINVLIQRYLLTIDERNKLIMHDIGREVREEDPKKIIIMQ